MSHKDTKGKLKLNLIPPSSQIAIATVREFGSNKYGDPWGWQTACKSEEFIEAAKRHLLQIDLGTNLDEESKLPHLWHALTSLAMAVEVDAGKNLKDAELEPNVTQNEGYWDENLSCELCGESKKCKDSCIVELAKTVQMI